MEYPYISKGNPYVFTLYSISPRVYQSYLSEPLYGTP